MKILLPLLIGFALCGEVTSVEFISPAVEKVNSYYGKLQKLAREKNILEIKIALAEIDTILQTNPDNAVSCMCWSTTLACLGHLRQDDLIQTGIDVYLDKIIKLNVDDLEGKFKQISLLQMLLLPCQLLYPLDDNMGTKRAERVMRLIELHMEIYERYEPDWDPDDPKNIPVSESKFYTFISFDPNMRPNPVTNPKEAAMYERFIQKKAEFWEKRSDQERLKYFPEYFKITNEDIVRAYSIAPRDDEGLARLLENSKYPVEEQQKILVAVKESWENPPPPPPVVAAVPKVELGPFLPRPGESLDDFSKRREAEFGPLPKGHVLHADGSISNTTVTEYTIPKIIAIEPYVSPPKEPIPRWRIALSVGSLVLLLLLAWYFHRKGI